MDYQLLLMCCAALLAGFVDAVVGGGGLVQVPALFILYPHFEIPRIIGTNRFSSFMGTAVAGYQYAKKVEIPWLTVIYAGIGAGIMAFLGAKISDLIDEKILKPIILRPQQHPQNPPRERHSTLIVVGNPFDFG